ncbi:hypothetical protein BRC91_04850 [Halobacteriales archaeon QS_4_62_28]|nr:MAG: hypothetical protein BRC91_04850 [Halobacteriales archaeon QS_4_62_28]
MDPNDSETACFEAGVKFGSLYHQFAGTPISPESADSLATAMAEAIENQPHCRDVTVRIREDALRAAIDQQSADYTEFTGRFADVEMVIDYEDVTVETSMQTDGDYPLMAVEEVIHSET